MNKITIQFDDKYFSFKTDKFYYFNLDDFPILKNATEKQRNNYRIIGNNHVIHWEDLDYDLSISGLVEQRRKRLREYAKRLTKKLTGREIW